MVLFSPHCNLLEFSPIISSSVKVSRHIQRTAVPSCSPVPPLLNIKYVFNFLITLYIKCTQFFVVLLWSRTRTVRNLRYPEGVLYIRRRRRSVKKSFIHSLNSFIHSFIQFIWFIIYKIQCTTKLLSFWTCSNANFFLLKAKSTRLRKVHKYILRFIYNFDLRWY